MNQGRKIVLTLEITINHGIELHYVITRALLLLKLFHCACDGYMNVKQAITAVIVQIDSSFTIGTEDSYYIQLGRRNGSGMKFRQTQWRKD